MEDAIERQHCAIETFDGISLKVKDDKYFTSLDATREFYQILLRKKGANLSTVGTPFGRYKS